MTQIFKLVRYIGNNSVLLKVNNLSLEYFVNSKFKMLVGKNSFGSEESVDMFYYEDYIPMKKADEGNLIELRSVNTRIDSGGYVEIELSPSQGVYQLAHNIVSFCFPNFKNEETKSWYAIYPNRCSNDHINGMKIFNHSTNIQTVLKAVNIFRAWKNYNNKSFYQNLLDQELVVVEAMDDQDFIDFVYKELRSEGYEE
jgi:hypothetical protein